MISRFTERSFCVCSSSDPPCLLEFYDGDKPLGTVIRHGYRRNPAAGYLLDRRLDVVRIVIASIDDEHILYAAP